MIDLNFAIVPNPTKEGAPACTKRVAEILVKNGGVPMLLNEYQKYVPAGGARFFQGIDALVTASDIVITVGGDGTIISVAKYAAAAGKPLLGINLGRLGFVAGLEPNRLCELSRLFTGDYRCENRMMLKASVIKENSEKVYYALNDVTVSRGSLSRIIDLTVSLNDEEATQASITSAENNKKSTSVDEKMSQQINEASYTESEAWKAYKLVSETAEDETAGETGTSESVAGESGETSAETENSSESAAESES